MASQKRVNSPCVQLGPPRELLRLRAEGKCLGLGGGGGRVASCVCGGGVGIRARLWASRRLGASSLGVLPYHGYLPSAGVDSWYQAQEGGLRKRVRGAGVALSGSPALATTLPPVTTQAGKWRVTCWRKVS